jgi:hypothetical protein
MKLNRQFFASSRGKVFLFPPIHLPQWRERKSAGAASDPIEQRPENAVFRQIARVRRGADWLCARREDGGGTTAGTAKDC